MPKPIAKFSWHRAARCFISLLLLSYGFCCAIRSVATAAFLSVQAKPQCIVIMLKDESVKIFEVVDDSLVLVVNSCI